MSWLEEVSIAPDAPIVEVLAKLVGKEILCVCGGGLVGVITPKDISSYMQTHNVSVGNVTAADVCNKSFSFVTLDTVEAELKNVSHHRKIPLCDEAGQLLYIYDNSSLDSKWSEAQEYEINSWYRRATSGSYEPYMNPTKAPFVVSERAINVQSVADLLNESFEGKNVLELGAGPRMGFIPAITTAKERIVVEPLAEKYVELRKKLGIEIPNTEDVRVYGCGGDVYIDALRDYVDGLVICQNALDHTPAWPFILSNIGLYATTGCLLYLWTDVDHGVAEVAGHFNITPYPERLIRFVESIGMKILYRKISADAYSGNLNVCLVAQKVKGGIE